MTVAYEMTCPACGREDHTRDCPRRERPVRRRATVNINRLSKRTLTVLSQEYHAGINAAYPRPRTRGECDAYDFGEGPVRLGVDVPCPFASCWYHNKHEVSECSGSIKDLFPDVELEDMPAAQTCTLRIADAGGLTLEEVGAATARTRERVRQIEERGLEMMRGARGISRCETTEDRPEYLPQVRVRRSIPRCEDHRTSREPLPEARPWSRDDHSRIFNRVPYSKRDL